MRSNSTPDHFELGGYLPFPHFLASAAGWAHKHSASQIILRDSIARRESYQTYLDYVHVLNPDYIFIETATPSWAHDAHITKLLYEACSSARIVICGTVTSTRSADILEHCPNVVACIQGEYEKASVKVINGATGIIPRDLLTKEEMADQPYPLQDEVAALHYWDACPQGQRYPQAQIWSSRGCPFRCCFCSWPAVMTGNDPDGTGKRSVRFYPPEYMERYIRHLIARYGYKCIYFDDDTFNLSDKHVEGMCAVMKRIGLPWSAMCRADTIKLENWQLMKDAGCFGVKVGMESGSQSVLDGIVNKRLNLQDVETRILPAIVATGMTVHTTWTVGLPGESDAQRQETVDMITRLYDQHLHHTHQLSGTSEIEGTPLNTLMNVPRGTVLKAYPLATPDGYTRTGDGQAKIEQMQREAMIPRLR